MPARAACISGDSNPGYPSTRRWDIDHAILQLLNPESKTASQLFRLLNPGMRRRWVLTAAGWKARTLNVRVDKRVLMRHLRYLQRDGLITTQPCLKILHHDRGLAVWNVKHYGLPREQGGGTPPRSPLIQPIHVSEIHNPFVGERGMLRFIRWLRNPRSK